MATERHFSDEEARAIFARAARTPTRAASTAGLTLADLQRAGAEAGLDPADVAAAAAALGRRDAPARTTWGMPTEMRRRRVLPVGVNDAAWEAMAGHLRTIYGGPGTAGQTGRVREWTSPGAYEGKGNRPQVHVTARPVEGGMTEVTIERLNARQSAQTLQAIAGAFGAMGAVLMGLLAGFAEEGWKAGLWGVPLVVAAVLVVAVGIPTVRSSMRRQAADADAALDRLDLIARTRSPTAVSQPRLSLDTDDLSVVPHLHDAARLRTR